MCRADVAEAAQAPLAAVLLEMAENLAAMVGADPRDVLIGPVDFGPVEAERG